MPGDYAIEPPPSRSTVDGRGDPPKGRGSWHYDLFQQVTYPREKKLENDDSGGRVARPKMG